MLKSQLAAILALAALIGSFLPPASSATTSDVVISEVVSNPSSETTDEFIELYNTRDITVSLSNWHFTDGDALDEIIAWDPTAHGDIPNTTLNTTTIPAESYAVILDPDYNSGGLPYNFPTGTVILTVTNSSLGNGLTPSSDPLVLYRAGGTALDYLADTYGTPLLDDDPLLCADDGLDDIPFDPGDGVSVEKIVLAAPDVFDNWSSNADSSSTPGALNHPLINQPPQIADTEVVPNPVPIDGATSTLIKAKVTDPDSAADISSVSLDLSSLDGSAEQTLYDDGSHGDELDGDEWYSFSYLPPDDTRAGSYNLTITAADSQGQVATQSISLTLEEVEYSDQVMINELLPNPSGTDTANEFIEFFNSDDETINLSNWQLTDGSTTYKIPAGTALEKDKYLAFYSAQTKISLNNGGDTVSLLTPQGDLVSKVTYTAAPGEDISYMRDVDNKFAWTTTPTPNAANKLTEEEEDEDKDDDNGGDGDNGDGSGGTTPTPTPTATPTATKSTSTKASAATFQTMSIADARQAAKNTKAKITGIVTAAPKMLSDKFFYIQDSTSGIQIYSSKSDFPELKLGQEIEVSGTVSEAQGEKKINVAADAIKILGQKEVPAAQATPTGKVMEELEGKLIALNGAVSRQSGKTFYADDGGGEAKISITGDFEKPDLTKGDPIQITGIVGQTTSGYRVMPRSAEDIKPGAGGGAEPTDAANSIKKLPAAGPSSSLFIIIAIVAAGAGVAIKLIWSHKNPGQRPVS